MFASSRVRTISSTSGAPSSAMTASTTSSTLGSIASSSGRAEGMIPSRAAIRLDRRAQVAPRRLLHAGGDLGAEAAGQRPLLGRHERSRARDRLEHGVELHRDELGERDDLAEDLVLEDELRHGVEHDREHSAVGDDRRRALREVGRGERERRIRATRLAHGELADVPVLRAADRAPVEQLVLDEEHRALVVDRRREQRADVVALARRDDDDVRDPEQELLERLRVRRPVAAPRSHRRAHDERAPSPGRRTSRGTSRSRSRSGRGRARRSRRT